MSVRTTQPSNTNKYYLRYTGGGYNRCILGNAKNGRPTRYSVLPNCVGYAYGRYLEYWGLTSANLPTCNAKNWYSVAKSNGFKCSTTPSVGSVAVFKGTTYGHVAFVERIESNGDLFLSESNWSHQIFRNVTVKKSNGYNYSNSLKLVGFVANPKAKTSTSTNKTTSKKTNTTTSTTRYTVGNYKVTKADVLNVRYGAGTNYPKKNYLHLSADARRKILAIAGKRVDGYVKGLAFTVRSVNGEWGRTDSGWVNLKYCTKL